MSQTQPPVSPVSCSRFSVATHATSSSRPGGPYRAPGGAPGGRANGTTRNNSEVIRLVSVGGQHSAPIGVSTKDVGDRVRSQREPAAFEAEREALANEPEVQPW